MKQTDRSDGISFDQHEKVRVAYNKAKDAVSAVDGKEQLKEYANLQTAETWLSLEIPVKYENETLKQALEVQIGQELPVELSLGTQNPQAVEIPQKKESDYSKFVFALAGGVIKGLTLWKKKENSSGSEVEQEVTDTVLGGSFDDFGSRVEQGKTDAAQLEIEFKELKMFYEKNKGNLKALSEKYAEVNKNLSQRLENVVKLFGKGEKLKAVGIENSQILKKISEQISVLKIEKLKQGEKYKNLERQVDLEDNTKSEYYDIAKLVTLQ